MKLNFNFLKGLKNAKTHEKREYFMMELVKLYLDLYEMDNSKNKYTTQYMNGIKIKIIVK